MILQILPLRSTTTTTVAYQEYTKSTLAVMLLLLLYYSAIVLLQPCTRLDILVLQTILLYWRTTTVAIQSTRLVPGTFNSHYDTPRLPIKQ
jgi:hypothetical protein